eukprot:gb/GEZN01014798.1/.p1 GENE.gb/GEZN01014798.1/~~gb/GEZN01014798.1/.p1  ORF type:complete len:260 (-),score=16.84 gb/GEZN01014798.1/:92-871(-)
MKETSRQAPLKDINSKRAHYGKFKTIHRRPGLVAMDMQNSKRQSAFSSSMPESEPESEPSSCLASGSSRTNTPPLPFSSISVKTPSPHKPLNPTASPSRKTSSPHKSPRKSPRKKHPPSPKLRRSPRKRKPRTENDSSNACHRNLVVPFSSTFSSFLDEPCLHVCTQPIPIPRSSSSHGGEFRYRSVPPFVPLRIARAAPDAGSSIVTKYLGPRSRRDKEQLCRSCGSYSPEDDKLGEHTPSDCETNGYFNPFLGDLDM